MDPRFDPTCKPIPDNRSKSRRNTAVGSDDEKKSEGEGKKYRTEEQEERMIRMKVVSEGEKERKI